MLARVEALSAAERLYHYSYMCRLLTGLVIGLVLLLVLSTVKLTTFTAAPVACCLMRTNSSWNMKTLNCLRFHILLISIIIGYSGLQIHHAAFAIFIHWTLPSLEK